MKITKLSEKEANALVISHPMLPLEYVSYLTTHGWGRTPTGKMLYSGPTTADEIYGAPTGPDGLLVLGDDFAGYCFAYDPTAGEYGELDPSGCWEPWPSKTGFIAYVAA